MKPHHKILCVIIFAAIAIVSYGLKAKFTEALSQNLVTFFSISFGFFMTTLAIVFNSSYVKELYSKIADSGDKREIHIFSAYIKLSAFWSMFSIVLNLIYMMFATKKDDQLILNLGNCSFYGLNFNLDSLAISVIFGISAINIFLMVLVFNSLLYGMLVEAKS